MTRPISIAFVLGAALAVALPGVLADEHADQDPGLVVWMGRIQYFAHKLGLALAAGNPTLQAFYAHEVEEIAERIERIRELDGVAIGKLADSYLEPAVKTVQAAIAAGDPARVDSAYSELLDACNACHKAANRPYIHIQRRTDNPYPQDFAPLP